MTFLMRKKLNLSGRSRECIGITHRPAKLWNFAHALKYYPQISWEWKWRIVAGAEASPYTIHSETVASKSRKAAHPSTHLVAQDCSKASNDTAAATGWRTHWIIFGFTKFHFLDLVFFFHLSAGSLFCDLPCILEDESCNHMGKTYIGIVVCILQEGCCSACLCAAWDRVWRVYLRCVTLFYLSKNNLLSANEGCKRRNKQSLVVPSKKVDLCHFGLELVMWHLPQKSSIVCIY